MPAINKRVRRKVTRKIEDVSGYHPIAGRVGATRTLIDTPIPGLIYVRIEGSGQVVTAINSIAPSEYNHPVLLARSKTNKKMWEVIASRQAYNVPLNGNLRNHHAQHEYPGLDTVWVKADQFLPFLVLPKTVFTVQIYGGIATLHNERFTIANQELNLIDDLPETGAVWVLIEVDSTGAIDTVVSTEYDSKELLTPDLIPQASAGAWDICAVRLYAGQEQIQRTLGTDNDIADLRFGRSDGNAHNHNGTHPRRWLDTTNPSIDDDVTAGFLVSDLWINTVDDVAFILLDNTDGAAAWQQIGGNGTMVIDDLTSQVPAVDDHFDLTNPASGIVMLIWNGTFQRPEHFTMDGDNEGLTTDFSPDGTDTLVAVYGVGNFITLTDAFRSTIDAQFDALEEKTTLHKDDLVVIEDSEDGFSKKKAKKSKISNFKIEYEVSATEAGQTQNATTAGSFQTHRAFVEITQPIRLSSVAWDVNNAATYRLRIYRGWQTTTHFFSGNFVASGAEAADWGVNQYLMPGKYVFELYRTEGANTLKHHTTDSSIADPLVLGYMIVERTQYDASFNIGFSPALRLTSYLGTEVVDENS